MPCKEEEDDSQIARLKEWAIANDCWIEPKTLGTFSDRGSENEVYASPDSRHVYKLNDFRYSDDNLTPFFERIQRFTTNFSLIVPRILLGLQRTVTARYVLFFVSPLFFLNARLPNKK